MTSDYEWIERAVQVAHEGNRSQPNLDQLAAELGLSLSGCDGLVRRWAGIDPQTFLRILFSHIGVEKNYRIRTDELDTPRFSNSMNPRDDRVHVVDLKSNDSKHDQQCLDIRYGEHDSPFGRMFLAVTQMGICNLSFPEEAEYGGMLTSLEQTWSGTAVKEDNRTTAPIAAALFKQDNTKKHRFDVVLEGTEFQVKVWKTLLKIPMGKVCSYQQVARAIGQPNASRAVGSAVAANPVAYLIPCHRVIRSSGATGEYRWGQSRKRAMLFWETCKGLTD